MSKTIENLKSGNYEVVDNQGVSVTNHFIECLEKELANCIEPKFKVGQKIYVVGIETVEEVEYFGENIDGIITFEEGCRCGCIPDRYSVEKRENVFSTEEEAKAKLEEMKNG